MTDRSANIDRSALWGALLVVPIAVLVASLQAAVFFSTYAPAVADANTRLFDLMVEHAQRTEFRAVARQVEALRKSPATAPAKNLATAWDRFGSHFAAAPRDAIAGMQSDLVALRPELGAEPDALKELETGLARLERIYADEWRSLAAAATDPPAYLWPTAGMVASLSGFREAITLNRALYLAQTGDIGTARVMLAGLNASAEDPGLRAVTYYVLARLQLALFRSTQEVEYYQQSLQYLDQSLKFDPGLELAKRLLDYLLSLSRAEAVPQSAEGRPETPSEGEGAAVSAGKRIF